MLHEPLPAGCTMTSELNAAAIKAWLNTVGASGLPTGLSVSESLERAEELRHRLIDGVDVGDALDSSVAIPDLLHALAWLLASDRGEALIDRLQAVSAAYGLAKSETRLPDADERDGLCARFAYVAWNICRANARFGAMRYWEQQCAEHAVAQAGVRDYLSLAFSERSEELNERFLADPATLLATCRRFAAERNLTPESVAREGAMVYRWLTAGWRGAESEEGCYFAGDLAFSVTGALRHLGRFREAEDWADLAEEWFGRLTDSEPWLLKLDHMRAVVLYDKHSPNEALAKIPRLLQELKRLDMQEELQRCLLLEAMVLKDLGRSEEALERFRAAECEVSANDHLSLGLIHTNIGEITATQGDFEGSMKSLSAALPLLQRAAAPWALAFLQGVLAEAFRDRGRLSEAVQAYRASIATCEENRMSFRAAYVRLVLAETLIAAGREIEATQEIVAALPILEREAVITDSVAALALLRESLRRQQADPAILRALRAHLHDVGQDSRS